MTRNETLKQEMRDVLENNILRFWIDRMQDDEHGGFYGRIDNQNVLHADAEKGAILNARILWTFSAAYRVLGKPEYLEMANRAKQYFIDHFIDPEHGEWYWSRHRDGSLNSVDDKAGFWKCPYHNGRMCLEIIERVSAKE